MDGLEGQHMYDQLLMKIIKTKKYYFFKQTDNHDEIYGAIMDKKK